MQDPDSAVHAEITGMDRLRKPVTWIVVGWVLAGLGFVFSVLMVLQPWRSCPDDDSAAGCPVTLVDANLTIGALMMMGAGSSRIQRLIAVSFLPGSRFWRLRQIPVPGY